MKPKIIAVIILCLLFAGCSAGSSKEYVSDFFAMDTFMRITAYGSGAENGAGAAARRIAELERLLSVTDGNSEIYALNHSGNAGVSSETADLISFALNVAESTDGALEPTIYPVLSAWGFTTDNHRVPSEEEISELLKNVDYKSVTVDENTVTLGEGMMLDLGAVAKGYAGDEAERILRENGVESALIYLGGNIQLLGKKPDGSEWRLGIKDPASEGNVGILSASDCAVVTSGNYERSFTADDGTVYGHIIDPENGIPVNNGLLSATIVAKEGRMCDALSTALFVMGSDGAQEYWRANNNFDMILITDDGEIFITDGISDSFELDSAHTSLSVKILYK